MAVPAWPWEVFDITDRAGNLTTVTVGAVTTVNDVITDIKRGCQSHGILELRVKRVYRLQIAVQPFCNPLTVTEAAVAPRRRIWVF